MAKDLQNQKNLIFLPVAHHSPVCAYRVEKAMRQTEFDTLFIELPQEAQNLLEAVTDKRTRLPVSLLFREGDKEAVLPLAEYSPEYVALKTASELGKKIVCIDSARFFIEGECGAQFDGQSAFDAVSAIENFTFAAYDSPDFFEIFSAFAEKLDVAPTDRDAYMAGLIQNTPYKRGIVVAGALHCANIKRAAASTLQNGWTGKSYVIPYVPEGGLVARYGYYAALFRRLQSSSEPFTAAAADCLLKQSEKVTKDYPFEHIPVTDVINTLTHTSMLADLRGKRFAGYEEICESAQSVIAKGEIRSVREHCLKQVLNGVPQGELAPGFATPLAEDFLRQLKKFAIRGEADSRITLQILENPAHRTKSAFLKRVYSLIGEKFAEMESGANYAAGKDVNKVREVWKVRGTAFAITALTYVSHLGATVAEAAQNKLFQSLEETEISASSALTDTYMQAYFLKLDARPAFEKLSESVLHVNDFSEAVSAISNLVFLIDLKKVFEGKRFENDVKIAELLYGKALRLLAGLWQTDDGEKCAFALSKLNNVVRTADYLDGESLATAVACAPSYAQPCLYGCASAIAAKGKNEILSKIKRYILSQTSAADAADYFLGCAIGDRGLITERRLLEIAAEFVERMSLPEFLDAAPSLRYAFSFLKLTERNSARKIIGEIYGEDAPVFFTDENLLLKDEYLARQLELYGLRGGPDER